jgi:alkaline phosphatase
MMSWRSKTAKCAAAGVVVLALHGGATGLYAGEWARGRNIILFIGDGMQLEHEVAASRYLYGTDNRLVFHMFPYQTDVSTWDVTTYNGYAAGPAYDAAAIVPSLGYDPERGGDRPYPLQTAGIEEGYFLSPRYATDSASAATAWATGYKTDDGNIAWLPGDPDAGELDTIAEILRARKRMAVGIVSTVPFSHATPAAHVSHNKSRNNYPEIADEIIRSFQPEVVIGGGHPLWRSGYMSDILYQDVKNGAFQDYVFVERQPGVNGGQSLREAALEAVRRHKKLFGLFGGLGGNFESPVPQDTPGFPRVEPASLENPLLRDATWAALEVLSRNRKGFFLMVEQGDIDWANHANDFSRMVGTTWDLNEGVKAAIEFVNRPGDSVTWENTLLVVTSDHGNSFMRLNPSQPLGIGDLPSQVCSPACTYPEGEVTFGTTQHTNELVRLYALGTGASLFQQYEGGWYPCTRILDNTHIFNVMAEAGGVRNRSPLAVVPEQLPPCDHPKPDSTR